MTAPVATASTLTPSTLQNTIGPRGAVSQVFQTMTSYDEIWTGHVQKCSATIAEASFSMSLLPTADRLIYNQSTPPPLLDEYVIWQYFIHLW